LGADGEAPKFASLGPLYLYATWNGDYGPSNQDAASLKVHIIPSESACLTSPTSCPGDDCEHRAPIGVRAELMLHDFPDVRRRRRI
jgi:hypothetical protein